MVLMSRYVIPEMRKVGRGSIVNMASVSGCKAILLNVTEPNLTYPQ